MNQNGKLFFEKVSKKSNFIPTIFTILHECLRPVAINYLKVLEKSKTGLHLHDHWTRWQLENPRNIEYAEHVVFCTLTPASPEEPSFKKLKLHKDLAIESKNNNNSNVTRTRKAATAKKTSASSKRR